MEEALHDIENASAGTTPVELTWSTGQESLLLKWAADAHKNSMLHQDAEELYSHVNSLLSTPVSILSIVCAIGNAIIGFMFETDAMRVVNYVLSSLSIVILILTTCSKEFTVPQLIEAHRNAHMQWFKVHRAIDMELSLQRYKRVNCFDFTKIMRAEQDRLVTASPRVPRFLKAWLEADLKTGARTIVGTTVNTETPPSRSSGNSGGSPQSSNSASSGSSSSSGSVSIPSIPTVHLQPTQHDHVVIVVKDEDKHGHQVHQGHQGHQGPQRQQGNHSHQSHTREHKHGSGSGGRSGDDSHEATHHRHNMF